MLEIGTFDSWSAGLGESETSSSCVGTCQSLHTNWQGKSEEPCRAFCGTAPQLAKEEALALLFPAPSGGPHAASTGRAAVVLLLDGPSLFLLIVFSILLVYFLLLLLFSFGLDATGGHAVWAGDLDRPGEPDPWFVVGNHMREGSLVRLAGTYPSVVWVVPETYPCGRVDWMSDESWTGGCLSSEQGKELGQA
jgi:hypothetical protein